jgi:integrase
MRRRHKVYGKTKTEIRDKLQELHKTLAAGVKPDARYRVADAVNDSLSRGLKGCSAKTVDKNRNLAAIHLIPEIGHQRLADLTADQVDDWLEGKRSALAIRSLQDLLAVLRRSIEHAQRREKVGRNVVSLVVAPTGRTGRPSKALTMAQARSILAAAKGTRLQAYIVISLLTGIRPEEARALEWDRVVLARAGDIPPHVMVWRSARVGGDTKTKKSRRTLALPPIAVEVLATHREGQQRDRARAGRDWQEHNLVFCSRVPDALAACPPSEQMYYDQVAQIVVPQWSRGRVVLLGDSCYAVSLLAGLGSSLAVAGAYVLAEQLHRAPSIAKALAGYERVWRPLAEEKQQTGRDGARWFLPETPMQLRLRRTALRLMRLPVVNRYAAIVGGKSTAVIKNLTHDTARASTAGSPAPC